LPRDPARPESSKKSLNFFQGEWSLSSCSPSSQGSSLCPGVGGSHLTPDTVMFASASCPKVRTADLFSSLRILSRVFTGWSVDSNRTRAGGEAARHLAFLRWQPLATDVLSASCELGPCCLLAVLHPEEKGSVWKRLLTLRVQDGICS